MENKNLLGRINDIFYSLQGEGCYQGEYQVFVRFSGCNMKCAFCDTDHSGYKLYTLSEVVKIINDIAIEKYVHSVSITGGEPLLQIECLGNLLFELKNIGYTTYLETNGVLCNNVKKILSFLDVIAMDIKMPSSTGDKSYWAEHECFLNIIKDKNVFVKIVVTGVSDINEWCKAIDIISQVKPDVQLILQPVTSINGVKEPSRFIVDEFIDIARKRNIKCRVSGQIHKVLGIK